MLLVVLLAGGWCVVEAQVQDGALIPSYQSCVLSFLSLSMLLGFACFRPGMLVVVLLAGGWCVVEAQV